MGLREYKRKRDFARTPEPSGRERATRGRRLFIVQKHAARRLHYDFRLEHGGVLWSWAVPKGPSFDPKEKRLAVHVEDHPVEYGGFEGVIPEGEYGGGSVMLWDRGSWEPLGDPDTQYREGKLKFRLHGEKLVGAWTLVRMSGSRGEGGKNWLLIKERDEHVRPHVEFDVTEAMPLSVESGRTMQEIAAARERVWHSDERKGAGEAPRSRKRRVPAAPRSVSSNLDARSGAVRAPMPSSLAPQLATLAAEPPKGAEWLHELKLDGYRMLAFVEGGAVRMLTRRGHDWTAKLATVARVVASVPVESAVLDGEVCVVKSDGTTDFQALQNALHEGAKAKLVYYVFDLPYCDGVDLREVPLVDRKEILRTLVHASPEHGARLVYSDHLEGRGQDVFDYACKLGMEGIVSKRRDAPYASKRTAAWLKTKCHLRQEFVVGGYTEPEGSRSGFGALLLGTYDGEALRYHGRVGTGFDEALLDSLLRAMKKLERKTPPFADPPKGAAARGVHWLEPVLVAEVKFAEFTADDTLRQPSFEGLREDKDARDVVREQPKKPGTSPPKSESPTRPQRAKGEVSVAGVRLTNPDRVYWPELGLTKLELAELYVALADWALPHLTRRPLSILRCPDGYQGQCFYQKHLGEGAPEDIGRVLVEEKENKGEYLQIRDVAGLVSLAQIGALEIHPWPCRADRLERPDFMVFDLDPGPGVVWDRVLEGALVMHMRLAELGLASFVKTSGGKGLHVVVPLARRGGWDEMKELSRLVAEDMARREPRKYTAVMSKAHRGGKIFIDYLRNTRGATSIGNYSTRARAGVPMAVPLDWQELDTVHGAAQFTARNILARIHSLEKDPWHGFYETRQSITAAMRDALTQARAARRP